MPPQIALQGNDVYKLLENGTIKKFNSLATIWNTIDINVDNAQIYVQSRLSVRRKNGDVLIWNGTSFDKLRGGIQRYWASNDYYCLLESGTYDLTFVNTNTGNTVLLEKNARSLKEIVSTSKYMYKLHTDGQVFYYDYTSWVVVGPYEPNTEQIVSEGSQFVYKRLKDGWVSSWEIASGWKVLGNDLRTVQIANGKAGLFQRLSNGHIFMHINDTRWDWVDWNSDNVDIVVADSAYRVNSKGEVYVLTDAAAGDWKLLEDVGGKPNGDNSNATIEAEAVYAAGNPTTVPTLLKIGNGGAGQVGLLKVISDAFIRHMTASGSPPFKVEWFKSDTTESITYLKDAIVDVAITYTPAAERLAIKQGIVTKPRYYIFREHFLLVGPKSNPANLDPDHDIDEQFSDLFTAAEAGGANPKVRFLSRYDKSATNIKDSELWIKLGQVPWATKKSPWYHQFMAYPIQALKEAADLEEYTLTDWGTYLSVDDDVRNRIEIYKKGSEGSFDSLLMQAHLLIGAKAKNAVMAKTFAEWLVSNTGQAVITSFQKNDTQVYSVAPKFQD